MGKFSGCGGGKADAGGGNDDSFLPSNRDFLPSRTRFFYPDSLHNFVEALILKVIALE